MLDLIASVAILAMILTAIGTVSKGGTHDDVAGNAFVGCLGGLILGIIIAVVIKLLT